MSVMFGSLRRPAAPCDAFRAFECAPFREPLYFMVHESPFHIWGHVKLNVARGHVSRTRGSVATNQRVKKFVLLLSLWVRAREEVELLIELLSSSSPSEGDARLEVDREREQRGFRQS